MADVASYIQAVLARALPMPATTGMGNGPPQWLGGQSGSPSAPSSDPAPIVSYTKYFSGNNTGVYEGGSAWFSVYVEGGTQWSKALTGYAQVDGGTNISAVGSMGFGVASATATGASVWGLWAHAHDLATVLQNQALGCELDLVVAVDRPRVTGAIGNNAAAGLWVVNQSDELGNFNATFAIGIAGESNARGLGFTSQFRSGYFVQQNSIVGGSGTHEAMQINGGTVAANRYTGIRLLQQFDVGIDMSNATFTGGTYAMFLPNGSAKGGVIGFNDSVSGNYPGIYLNNAASNALVIGQGVPGGIILSTKTKCLAAVGVNGNSPPTQVTGFGTPTGIGVIANFPGATATLAQATETIAQIITDLKNFGLYGA